MGQLFLFSPDRHLNNVLRDSPFCCVYFEEKFARKQFYKLPCSHKKNFFNLTTFPMLKWVVILLILALVAAIFGFGGIAAAFVDIAQILFYIFLVLLLIFLIAGFTRGW